MIELRCGGTMHGKLSLVDGKLEVKCGRRICGARRGVVVLHTFDINSGDMVGTQKYADPIREGDLHGSR